MPSIRSMARAGACALFMVSAAQAGTYMDFTTDIYRVDSDGNIGSGQYVVFDLFVTVDPALANFKLLSIYNMNITGSHEFFHSDAAGGNWQASFSDETFGGKPWMDSFVTMGGNEQNSTAPFNAQLDGNFVGHADVAGTMAADAGWFNNNPNNGQGFVGENSSVMIARLVMDTMEDASINTSGTVTFNFNEPGVFFDNDTQFFSSEIPDPVPGPAGLATFAALGLCGRRRRRG